MKTKNGPKITPEIIEAQNRLVDTLLMEFGLKNDRALSLKMNVPPPAISKLRHGRQTVTDGMLVRIHETFDLSIKEIRRILAVEVPSSL